MNPAKTRNVRRPLSRDRRSAGRLRAALAVLVPLWALVGALGTGARTQAHEPFSVTAGGAAAPRVAAQPVGPEGKALEERLIRNARQLTFEGRRAGEGYFSKDGSQMVFQSEREPGNPFYQIYLMDLEFGDVERVSPGHGKTTCAWIHPDGERVLFASTHDDPDAVKKQEAEIAFRESGQERRYSWDYDEHFELYLKNVKTGEIERLTNSRGYDAEGSISPDGKLVCFSSNRDAYTEPMPEEDARLFELDKSFMLDLYIMNIDGTGLRRLTDVRGYDGGPFFSADGKKICWRRFSENGATAEIYTMNVDGTGEQRLTELDAMSWAPYFHPSGEYLIFTTNRHDWNFELYLVSADGQGEPVRVTYTEGFDGLPVFTPDGNGIAWTSNRAGGREGQLFIGDWDHETALRLITESKSAAESESDLATRVEAWLTETKPAISAAELEHHVLRLADEEMNGRQTGTLGERLATEYVARCFERIGLVPDGDDGWFQPFEFKAGVSLGEDNALEIAGLTGTNGDAPVPKALLAPAVGKDWTPLAFSRTGKAHEAGIVFAGYGIVAPEANGFAAYDSYDGLDVEDKWVLALRFMPEDITPDRRRTLNRYSSLRYKAMVARDRGAHGIVFVTGPNAAVNAELVPLAADASLAGTSLPVVSVSNALGDAIVAAAGRSLGELQSELDGGATVPGFEIPAVSMAATLDLVTETKTGRNVLGRLRSSGQAARRPFVLVGGHVDHLGTGGTGNSLARSDEEGEIHYGADDNASGVAAVIETAEYLKGLVDRGKLKLERDIVFAAWSGEEMGLLGSKAYVAALQEELGNPEKLRPAIAACLNLDMVGRLDEALVINGVASSKVWKAEIEKRNVPVGLPLKLSDDSYLPTDATSFYVAGVPILSLFTGAHSEYHSPRDVPELLDYDGLARITRLTSLLAMSVAQNPIAPDYVEVQQPETTGERAGLRVSLGTHPDYTATEVEGLRLDSVNSGGPADLAGLRGGDVVVELGGQKVENIYDYMFAIDSLKPDEETVVTVMRGRERLTFKITPSARK